MSEAPSRGKALTSWVGWLEQNEPDGITLEEWRRWQAEEQKPQRRARPS